MCGNAIRCDVCVICDVVVCDVCEMHNVCDVGIVGCYVCDESDM